MTSNNSPFLPELFFLRYILLSPQTPSPQEDSPERTLIIAALSSHLTLFFFLPLTKYK